MRVKIEKLWDFVEASFSINSGEYDAVIIPIIKENGKQIYCCRIKVRTPQIASTILQKDTEWYLDNGEVVVLNKTADDTRKIVEPILLIETVENIKIAIEKLKENSSCIFLIEHLMIPISNNGKNVVTEILCYEKNILKKIGGIPGLKGKFIYACEYAILDMSAEKAMDIIGPSLNN